MARRFKKGPLIPDVIDLIYLVLKGQTVWFNDKPLNAQFVIGMTMRTIIKNVEAGRFYYCLEVK